MAESPDIFENLTDQSISSIHHILRSPRRRLVILNLANRVVSNVTVTITYLEIPSDSEAELIISVRRLARELIAHQKGVPPSTVSGEEYRSMYTSLTQTHLDQLHKAGAVIYNDDRKVVEPGRNLLGFAAIIAITTPLTKLFFINHFDQLYNFHEYSE